MSFEVIASEIDYAKIKNFFGSEFKTLLSVNFWECKEGEILSGSWCELCDVGKYSFEVNSKSCSECLEHAQCLGGN